MDVRLNQAEPMADRLIVGGGVIGMMLARALAKRGERVTLMERSACGSQASWAGGGIVSPLYPWRYPAAVSRLASAAQQAYPALASDLLEETGVDIELVRTGLLMLRVEDQQEAVSWAARYAKSVERISEAQLNALQPDVGASQNDALWMPDVANLRNPRLIQALRESLRSLENVHLIEHAEVNGFQCSERNITGLYTSVGLRRAGSVIVCAGAWAGKLLASIDSIVPVAPVRGQMLLFEPRPGLLQRIVLADGKYLIPRKDGHILVGSTLEYAGFDTSTTEEAARELKAAAVRLLPALSSVPVKKHWSGLRPGAPEGIPCMGRVEGFENLFVSAGHFRNGLVLAPAATDFMLRYLDDKVTRDEAADYEPCSSSSSEPMPSFFMR